MCPALADKDTQSYDDLLGTGHHICQVYSDEQDRRDSLFRFILSGLNNDQRVACYSDKTSEEDLDQLLDACNVSYAEVKRSGALTLSPTREVYLASGEFDPERLLQGLRQFHDDSHAEGFSGSRVVGEMTHEASVAGGDRLIEYETKVSELVREYPVSAVCQYDAREFDGATIMDILRVHPMLLVHGSIVRNPYYTERSGS